MPSTDLCRWIINVPQGHPHLQHETARLVSQAVVPALNDGAVLAHATDYYVSKQGDCLWRCAPPTGRINPALAHPSAIRDWHVTELPQTVPQNQI